MSWTSRVFASGLGFCFALLLVRTAASDPPLCGIDPPNATSTLRQCPWYNASLSPEVRRGELLSAMSISEKLSVLQGSTNDRLHIPDHGFSEASHGVAWSGRATVFPCSMGVAATFDTALANRIGEVIAYEGLAKRWQSGKNHLSFFAPNINIVRDVRWGRAQETYGEDPFLTGELAASFIKGMQHPNGSGTPMAVRSVVKHFAAYNLESNFAIKDLPLDQYVGQYRLQYDANVSRQDLLQTFLPAFEAAVQSGGAKGIMCGYNSVNGVPLCANELLQTELRDRIGFDGIVISDCGAIGFMVSNHHWGGFNDTQVTAKSLAAGTDLNCGSEFNDHLQEALENNLINTSMIQTAAARSIDGWLDLGLLQDTETAAADSRRHVPMSVIDSPEHRSVARRAAQEGAVLLKNRARALPLAGADQKPVAQARGATGRLKLAVMGPNANRTLSLMSSYSGCKDSAGGAIDADCVLVTPLEGLSNATASSPAWEDQVLFEQAVDVDTNDTSRFGAAVEMANQADVVVFVGGLITCQEIGTECQEAEARDRSTPLATEGALADVGRDVGIGLPGKQLECLQMLANSSNTTIVLVIMSGSAVAVPWASSSDRIGAIVQTFYSGALGGSALADVLFGEVAPSGRLPVMVPVSEEQLPVNYLDQSMAAPPGRTHRYFTGVPLYNFGFGLGYSSFSYSHLALSSSTLDAASPHIDQNLTVWVTVTNNGEFLKTSDEVVLCFATPRLPSPTSSVPLQMLVGFKRVSTTPRSQMRVQIELSSKSFRLVDAAGEYKLVRGLYDLHVGGKAPSGGSSEGLDVATPLTSTISIL